MFVSVCMHGSLIYPKGLKTHSTARSVNAADSCVCGCVSFVCACVCVRQLPLFLKCYFVLILEVKTNTIITSPELCAPHKYSEAEMKHCGEKLQLKEHSHFVEMGKKGYYELC